LEDGSFYYSEQQNNFVLYIQQIFDKVADELLKIPFIEKNLMTDLYRKNVQLKERFLKNSCRTKKEESEVYQQKDPFEE
jgi:hypothetical protein